MPAGMQGKVALVKKATAWDAVAASANVVNAGFPIRGFTAGEAVGDLQVDDTWGNAQPKDADTGNINLSFDINAFARYDSLTRVWALFMGLAGVPTTVGVSGRTHTLKWKDSLDDIHATMVADLITSIDEFPSLKFGGFVLRQVAGQPCELTFNVFANTRRLSTDSTDLPVNTTLAAVTTITPRYRLHGRHLTVLANPIGAIALASPTHQIKPSEITFTVSRNMAQDAIFNGSNLLSEPELDNVPTATVAMTWPVHRAESDVQLRAAKLEAEWKMRLIYTHPDPNGAGTGFPYQFQFDLPRVRIGGPAKGHTGPGRINYTQTVQLLKPDVASAGMTGLLDMFQIISTNKDSLNPLA